MADELVKSKDTESVILFRFKNVADPEAIVPHINSRYSFLPNPNPSRSRFLTALRGRQPGTYTTIQGASAFSPIQSADEIINMNAPLYIFSGIIATTYPGRTTRDDIARQAQNVNPLTESQQISLWDNLYYQALTGGSTRLANTIVQVLRGDAFLREFNRQSERPREREAREAEETRVNDDDILQRIASANLVIPEDLFYSEDVLDEVGQGRPGTSTSDLRPDSNRPQSGGLGASNSGGFSGTGTGGLGAIGGGGGSGISGAAGTGGVYGRDEIGSDETGPVGNRQMLMREDDYGIGEEDPGRNQRRRRDDEGVDGRNGDDDRGESDRPTVTDRGGSDRPTVTDRGGSDRPTVTDRGGSDRPSGGVPDRNSDDREVPPEEAYSPRIDRWMRLRVGPDPNRETPGNADVKLYGIRRIGILEYKRVEQKICCYVAGEVSHIENVMAREYKEKASRTLTRSEISQEDTVETESEQQTDTTSTERNEVNREISKVLQEEQSRQIGIQAGATARYGKESGPFSITVNASTDMNFSNSSAANTSESISEAFAKEVVEKAMQRVLEKVSSKRTSRMLREYEETNKHGFDNREGDKHVTGIYRWVDKIYENLLINYGKRLQYDFMIPEPSRNFKEWMTSQPDSGSPLTYIQKPKELSSFGIRKWQDITETNYANAAAEFGADVKPPLEQFKEIGMAFAANPGKETAEEIRTGGYNFECKIPEGYGCQKFKYYFDYVWHGTQYNNVKAYVSIANKHEQTAENYGFAVIDKMAESLDIGGAISGDLGVTVTTRDVSSFTLNLILECKRKDPFFHEWQQATYIAIYKAYQKRWEEYNNALAASAPPTSPNAKIDYNFNPTMGRTIEQRELKRLCIESMLEPFGRTPIGQDYYAPDYYNHIMIRSEEFERHAQFVRFLEEAFSWDLMSYHFYPYYWGGNERWKELFMEKSTSDPMFQAFLQSGMARVTVPVRLGYEYAVVYFLNTGNLWRGINGLVVGGNTSFGTFGENLAIADLLIPEQGILEATWKSRVPTALTILQSDSNPLHENGLPCWCEDGTKIAENPKPNEEDNVNLVGGPRLRPVALNLGTLPRVNLPGQAGPQNPPGSTQP